MSGDPALDNALLLRRAGRLAEAADIYSQILRANPNHFEALHALGILRYQSGQIDEAERLIGAAIALQPSAAEAIYNRACLLLKLGRTDDAIAGFGQAIAVRPDYVEALTNRGGALMQLERYADAKADFDAVVAYAPAFAQAWNNRGSAAIKLNRQDEALESFDKALTLRPDYAEARKNRGMVFLLLGLNDQALADFDKAIALDPQSAEVWEKRGDALSARPAEAVASYNRALLLRPDHVDTIFRRANAHLALRQFEDAAAGYRRVLELDPHYEYARGSLLFSLMYCCDWKSRTEELVKLRTGLVKGEVALGPFAMLTLVEDPADCLPVARQFASKHFPATESLWRGDLYGHDRIRVAYLSANFNDHSVARLMAGVFEHHDKTKFETLGVAFGTDKGEMHTRVRRSFERFLDVGTKTDREAAQLIRELEVDIAVDLMGFTVHCRPGILSFRPAPVQVNYLGFPGTMGAGHIDYIIADRFVLPEDHRRHYAEQVVYLPDCYLPNDDASREMGAVPTRREAGLPDKGFVFCSFNQVYKFTPDLFDVWMRLLCAVEGSLLWLPACSPVAARNLRREAEARSVSAERLVFAPFTATVEEHIARLGLADLCLDTLPYNSHATACDCLLAGVPIVTCPGSTFAGRVAASALLAHGLPELIAGSLAHYEKLALSLARDPSKIATLKEKVARHRKTHSLFDTARFTRHLETAFDEMRRRRKAGEPARGFTVEPQPQRALA